MRIEQRNLLNDRFEAEKLISHELTHTRGYAKGGDYRSTMLKDLESTKYADQLTEIHAAIVENMAKNVWKYW